MDNPPGDDELSALYEQYATHIRPIITQTTDHKWPAQYPRLDWHVTADSAYMTSSQALTLNLILIAVASTVSGECHLQNNTKSPSVQHDSLITTREPRQIRSPPTHGTLS